MPLGGKAGVPAPAAATRMSTNVLSAPAGITARAPLGPSTVPPDGPTPIGAVTVSVAAALVTQVPVACVPLQARRLKLAPLSAGVVAGVV